MIEFTTASSDEFDEALATFEAFEARRAQLWAPAVARLSEDLRRMTAGEVPSSWLARRRTARSLRKFESIRDGWPCRLRWDARLRLAVTERRPRQV